MGQMTKIIYKALLALPLLLMLVSCERTPMLHLHREDNVCFEITNILFDVNAIWQYEIGYDWQSEWSYGWDNEDILAMGNLGYTEPTDFDIRRYYLGGESRIPHASVERFFINGNTFKSRFLYGYYDMLVWNRISTPDMVQSLVFDEASTLDSVYVSTRESTMSARYQTPAHNYAYNQPEELFAGYERDIHITDNPDDYDHYDAETKTYYKKMDMVLQPVTYIYLTQVRLHHNNGRVVGTEGVANLSGMARSVTLNTGITGKDVVSVHYFTRFKTDCVIKQTSEKVDIAGGRCLTFGIPNQNPSRISRAEDFDDRVKHYMDVHLMFYNGMDSTMVFDISDQIRRRFKGGVITIDLDMDTIPIPQRPGGSAFEAVVKEFDEENFFIDI